MISVQNALHILLYNKHLSLTTKNAQDYTCTIILIYLPIMAMLKVGMAQCVGCVCLLWSRALEV